MSFFNSEYKKCTCDVICTKATTCINRLAQLLNSVQLADPRINYNCRYMKVVTVNTTACRSAVVGRDQLLAV